MSANDFTFTSLDGVKVTINKEDAERQYSRHLARIARLESAGRTFSEFQRMNAERCRRAFPTCEDWTLSDWAVALAGEVGELCNLLKKNRRGLASDERYDLDGPFAESARQNVLSELSDVITYADAMMTQLSASTEMEVLGKYAEVSTRIGYREGLQ